METQCLSDSDMDGSVDRSMELQLDKLSFWCTWMLMHFLPGWQCLLQEELFILHSHLRVAHLLRQWQLSITIKCTIGNDNITHKYVPVGSWSTYYSAISDGLVLVNTNLLCNSSGADVNGWGDLSESAAPTDSVGDVSVVEWMWMGKETCPSQLHQLTV